MMTWNSMNFSNGSSSTMNYLLILNDHIMMFLLMIICMVLMLLLNLFINKNLFNLMFDKGIFIETIWLIIPIFILLSIAYPSIMNLYFMEDCYSCGTMVKIIGHQWYWSYKYFLGEFSSYMINNSSFNRLLELDNNLILPFNQPIQVTVTSEDVIHSWTIPSLGVKADAIPGRLNEMCFMMKKCGLLIGQCSEICGANHSFMPICIESIHPKIFWNMY